MHLFSFVQLKMGQLFLKNFDKHSKLRLNKNPQGKWWHGEMINVGFIDKKTKGKWIAFIENNKMFFIFTNQKILFIELSQGD